MNQQMKATTENSKLLSEVITINISKSLTEKRNYAQDLINDIKTDVVLK